MTEIATCLTVETIEAFQALMRNYGKFSKRFHVDVSDGQFAPTNLLPIDQMTFPQGVKVDFHLMVSQPSQYLNQLINLRPYTVIFHAECSEDLTLQIQALRSAGIRAGLAFLKKTVPKNKYELIKQVDHIMVFSGDLGRYGGTADMLQLEKVRLIRKIRPNVEIGWDGGASIDNVFRLKRGGVDVINVGGALSNSNDPMAVYNQMVNEINRQGVI
ncbi:hypothetical protein CR956_01165 [Candidatus Saccharibacteria bacterium]|nr:MAG: hypothetical protein CR956_01165 [Candidatus Saccharibacteria bacterium]